MSHHIQAQSLVPNGGSGVGSSGVQSDTYGFNGTSWSQIFVGTSGGQPAANSISIDPDLPLQALLKAPIAAQTSHGVLIGAFEGQTAGGVVPTENPLYNGGIAETSDQTAVTAGQKIAQEMTLNGKSVVQPYALPGALNSPATTGQTGTSAITVLSASGSASLSEYMTGLQAGRTDAGTTAFIITLTDGTSSRIWVIPNSGGGGGNNIIFPAPIKWAANVAVTCAISNAVTTFYCNAQGYNAP